MSLLTGGVDVGSSAVKTVLVAHDADGARILARRTDRLRHRDVAEAAEEAWAAVLREAGASPGDVAYVASTGEGHLVGFRTGHFYGMTSHARGGIELEPGASAVLDAGALHARAIAVAPAGRVLRYRMTGQCASGSGQFVENIGRYLGVALEEIGALSVASKNPEKCSGICAVLAETDVINMVSRRVPTADILRGIHLSMASRFVKLLGAADVEGVVVVTGGSAHDVGLMAALNDEATRTGAGFRLVAHPASIYAGALGAALWARYRVEKFAARRESAHGA